VFVRRKAAAPTIARGSPYFFVLFGKMQANAPLSATDPVLWLAPKILSLGKMQASFCSRLIRIFKEDTLARQNASELAFALAYSYLCPLFISIAS
jgi:hypothetical protein